MNLHAIRTWLLTTIATRLGVPEDEIDVDVPLASYGLGSRDAVQLSGELEDLLDRTLSPTVAYEYPTINALAGFLAGAPMPAADTQRDWPTNGSAPDPIAIVGLACRLPGASDPESYWDLLRSATDAVSETPADRWRIDDIDPAGERAGMRFGGFLRDIDRFDAGLFNIAPREARAMDPQQRLLLELTWEALERARIAPDRLAGSRTGVFVGMSSHDYGDVHMRYGASDEADAYLGTGNSGAVAAGRISYALGLQGPSMVVDTACSSSLVAVHLACRSLRAGESDLVIAGGVNVILSQEPSIGFSKAHMLSPRGRCRTFDASADGYVRAEGCGVVVLRRLSDAQARGDRILAVIRGTAVNQDGRTAGLTAPNGLAQTDVIRAAWRDAGVSAGDIGYVEAHGTGTLLGDPIEVRALGAALGGPAASRRAPCAIGSVKSNIGHTEAAAGIAGLIKVVLALQHREIPPSLHVESLNPHIAWGELPLTVARAAVPFEPIAGRRIAGVSSFGFSGTNAHAVLEEAAPVDDEAPRSIDRAQHVLRLSAHTPAALQALADRCAGQLEETDSAALADACFSVNTGRAELPQRMAAVGGSPIELAQALRAFAAGRTAPDIFAGRRRHDRAPRIAFLFTGQGAQFVGMGRGIYETQPVFRAAMDRCASLLDEVLPRPLLSVLYPPPGAPSPLNETEYAQPALFSLEYALAQLWQSWGITPVAVLGHSLGEWAAACVAGSISLEDAVRAVAARGRLMQGRDERGKMAAIAAAEEDVAAMLAPHGGQVVLAAVNAPRQVVISGHGVAVDEVLGSAARSGLAGRELAVSNAFHSPLMDRTREAFGDVLRRVRIDAPSMLFFSSVTGAVVEPDTIRQPEYWRDQIRKPVRFADAMRALGAEAIDACIEIGPGTTLLSFGRECLPASESRWVPSIVRQRDDTRQLLESLALLYAHGADVDWSGFDAPFARRAVLMPTYPFERERHWMAAADRASRNARPVQPQADAPNRHPLLGRPLSSPRLVDRVFESSLGAAVCPDLQDHRVGGAAIAPAAAHIEMAASAVRETTGALASIEDVRLLEPLPLSAGDRVVQVILTKEGDDHGSIEIVSRSASGADVNRWHQHVTARWTPAQAIAAAPFVEPSGEGWSERAPDDLYRELHRRGLEYGPCFQGIDALWCGETESVARIALPASATPSDAYLLHPALLDACFQAVAAIKAVERGSAGERNTYVPISLESFRAGTSCAGPLWVHAALREIGDEGGLVLTADIRIFDGDRRPIATVTGLAVKEISLQRLGLSAGDRVADWMFAVGWRAAALPPGQRDGAGEWLIVGDGHGLAGELSHALAGRGGSAVCVATAAAPETVHRMLAADAAPLRGIVHLDAGDAAIAGDLPATASSVVTGALRLVRAIAGTKPARWPQLSFVTLGTQSVGSDPRAGNLIQAPTAGFARTLALEHAELRPRLIDLDPSPVPAQIAALVDELLDREADDEVALRGGTRFVRRLERVAATPSADDIVVRADGTYLLTGGGGALGLHFAEWLVERGARHLVLTGRSQPSAAAREVIARLERAGAAVAFERADVGSHDEVRALLGRVKVSMPALRGIVHAAGVLKDGLVARMTDDDLAGVLRPKVDGAWHLHALTRALPIDFFVTFSSAAALFGSPGQANYAAANAFLDALARHRAADGLPAVSIGWGPWSGDGMASVMRTVDGLSLITPRDGVSAFARAMATGSSNVAVLPFAGSAQAAEALGRVPVLRDLASELAGPSPSGPARRARSDVRAAWSAAGPDERPRVLARYVSGEIAAIVRLPVERIDERVPFAALGVDSLMGLELRDHIAADLGITVPMATFVQTPTVEGLVVYLAAELDADAALGTSALPPGAAAADLLERVDDLSDQEVEALLAKFASAGATAQPGVSS